MRPRFQIKINSTLNIEIEDLGEDLNRAFTQFYQGSIGLNSEVFKSAVFGFLSSVNRAKLPYSSENESKAEYHDGLYNNLTIQWNNALVSGKLLQALQVWLIALRIVIKWEENNKTLTHKGSVYYYLAITYLEIGKINEGLVYMYSAYLEDLRKNNSNDNTLESPAKSFLTLDVINNAQFYKRRLDDLKHFLVTEMLPTKHSWDKFEKGFIENRKIPILLKYRFLQLALKIQSQFRLISQTSKNNKLMGIDLYDNISALSQLMEPIFRERHSTMSKDLKVKEIFGKLLKNGPLKKIWNSISYNNQVFEQNLESLIIKQELLLNGTILHLSKNDRDVLITLGFRNLNAHNLFVDELIIKNYKNIYRSLIKTFFKII